MVAPVDDTKQQHPQMQKGSLAAQRDGRIQCYTRKMTALFEPNYYNIHK